MVNCLSIINQRKETIQDMVEKKMNEMQGHWVLAKLGKKVLRPGGKELTARMLENLNIGEEDDVVEFAPGLGYTARLTCEKHPHSYTAVELNEEAAAIVRKNVMDVYPEMKIVLGNAAHTGLPEGYASRVYGEAMLTMQGRKQKEDIVNEAARILKTGGLYGVHEMGMSPDEVGDDIKKQINKDLAHNIKTNARPLTRKEWCELLEKAGFEVLTVMESGMFLLEPQRMIDDEGWWGVVKIVGRMLWNGKARQRVMSMRRTFKRHKEHINAIAIVARKK